jgi:hypothetical protein
MRMAITTDHGGFVLKEQLVRSVGTAQRASEKVWI